MFKNTQFLNNYLTLEIECMHNKYLALQRYQTYHNKIIIN
jgi:hypothetical protein